MKGFSLIELMVVVVIIGILATVGIPQYQKFQAKVKRSEARSLLGSMYTAQKAFYAEWRQYYGDFNAVGYALEGDLSYVVGFRAVTPGPAHHYSLEYRGSPQVISAFVYCRDKSCRVKNGLIHADLPMSAIAGQHIFTFGAAANLDSDPTKDQWTINELRQLVIITDDITIGTD